jgi:NADH dehydrogenase
MPLFICNIFTNEKKGIKMTKVIIIGASYAGLYAAKKLAKNKDIEILLFDKNDYHYMQVEAYGFVATKYDRTDVTISINQFIKKLNSNIKFYKNEIQSFDSDSNTITTIEKETFKYDYLIISTGSLTNFPIQVPNIQKYSTGIKTLQKATQVNKMYKAIIEKVDNNPEVKEYNIAIGGAGLSGVEIAAEMSTVFKNKKIYKINIYLIDGMPTILSNMHEKLVSECQKRLEELNIKIYLGSFIKDVDEKKIYLSNNTSIDYDYFIFTGGIKGMTINSVKNYEVNKLNQYISDDYLHLKGEENIFVIGDVSEVTYNNKYFAPTAQLAISSGQYVGQFIQNEINKVQSNILNTFTPKLKGTLVSLGGNYGIGLLLNRYVVKGVFIHLLKSLIAKIHKKSLS